MFRFFERNIKLKKDLFSTQQSLVTYIVKVTKGLVVAHQELSKIYSKLYWTFQQFEIKPRELFQVFKSGQVLRAVIIGRNLGLFTRPRKKTFFKVEKRRRKSYFSKLKHEIIIFQKWSGLLNLIISWYTLININKLENIKKNEKNIATCFCRFRATF